MRILVVSNLYPPRVRGGYELACFNLTNALRARGHDVRVLTSETVLATDEIPGDEFVSRSLEVRRFRDVIATDWAIEQFLGHESKVSNGHNTAVLLAALRSFRPDHVLMFNILGIGGLALVDLLNSVGASWTLNLGDRIPTMLLDEIAPGSAEVFGAVGGANYRRGQVAAISQTVADEALDEGVDLGERVRIISRGVLPHGITRSRGYQEGGITRFVSAGTINEQKGIDVSLDATRMLVDEGRRGTFRVDFYGDGQLDRYRARARELGIDDVAEFHGPVSQAEVLKINAGSDAFLFPTWDREPLGNAPLEAASVGCVPIMTASAGAAERLVNGVHAIKVPRDEYRFAQAMRDVLDGNVDLARLGGAGIRVTRESLSLDYSAVLLEQFISEGTAPGWQDALDSTELEAEVVAKDSESIRLLYRYIDEHVRAGVDGRVTIREKHLA